MKIISNRMSGLAKGALRCSWRAVFASLVMAIALASLAGCSGDDASAKGDFAPASAAQSVPAGEAQPAVVAENSSGIPSVEAGVPYVEMNGDKPAFTADDIAYAQANLGYEDYGDLDSLGRCTGAVACVGKETMPKRDEKRGRISDVHPSGWQSVRYGFVDGESLYNRCHLVAWMLSTENANERNLVTGTRFMNTKGMLPFERDVADYIDRTGNHVLYRVIPLFEGDELVCRGVQMEAYSLEDAGAGISYNVFCPNTQPGVGIDYATGKSWLDYEGSPDAPASANATSDETAAEPSVDTASAVSASDADEEAKTYVLNTKSHKFHTPDCSVVDKMSDANRLDYEGTRSEITADGFGPCSLCNP